MTKRLLLGLLLLLGACQSATPTAGWQLVYRNDAAGNATFGDKAALLDAVRLGYPIRIGWGSNRVEHVAEAEFLTIFDGEEVFAQIAPIVGQAPRIDGDTLKVRFRLKNHWTKIAGSNGFSTAFMTDYMQDTIVGGGDDRYTATSWYVNYPLGANPEIEARPLWREASPNWEKWNASQP